MNSQLSNSVREVGIGFQRVVRSEIKLARAELKDTAARMFGDSALFATGLVIALAGGSVFLAFLVIGLAKILHGNFLLSTLIIGLTFVVSGVTIFLVALGRFKENNFTLPVLRESVKQQVQKQLNNNNINKRSAA